MPGGMNGSGTTPSTLMASTISLARAAKMRSPTKKVATSTLAPARARSERIERLRMDGLATCAPTSHSCAKTSAITSSVNTTVCSIARRPRAGAGDAGKVIHVQTFGDPLTDLAVDVVQSDGTTSVLGGPMETGGPVDATTPAVTASTTYYVIFEAGTLGFSPTDGTYTGLVRLQ